MRFFLVMITILGLRVAYASYNDPQYDEALNKSKEALYKQSGLEKELKQWESNVTKKIKKYVPESVQKPVLFVYGALKIVENQRIELRWEFP